MRKSIFDSKGEEKLFKRLKTYWSKYLDVFPQLPPRNVFGYDEIMKSDMKTGAKNFLLTTSFDFVVCDINNHTPLLVIEFDGVSGGFSRDAEYFTQKTFRYDPYRKLKMKTKLQACRDFNIPAVVVSYQECDLLEESEQMINILDVIIADAIEKSEHAQNFGKYTDMLAEAYNYGGQDSVDDAMIEIEIMSERANPIKRKILELTKKFPHWGTQFYFAKPDEYGNLSASFNLNIDIETIEGEMFTKRLLSVNVSIRQAGVSTNDPLFLLNTIGEYCLAMKAKKALGFDWKNWSEAREKAEWVRY
ncbi:DUF2726 domain-containing protein [Chitinophaga silvisoli]|uniref:DUF2726 domain-containing protein n=1 Tax=Chitinophaga silvisoli TaxID=2291814 RepID=A0A3E1P2N9_9BACT|nr:DUF2726 domain-containing protein [Chitinophaga silvisoli]RFM34473.1 DUF2726 domain-containing protein [Chitinophaga silvisoli]